MGETYRADAQTWIKGIENVSGLKIDTLEVKSTKTRLGRIFMFLVFLFQIFKTNLKKSYDIVLAERSTSYGFFSLFVNAKKRVVAQQGITDIWPLTNFSLKVKPIFQSKAYQNADLIHAWGEVMVPAMLDAQADPNRILILPKGIDLDLYQFIGFEEKQRDLAIVTRSLTSVYNHADVLDALVILRDQGIKIKVIIVGDGELMTELEARVKSLDLEEMVQFTGRIPNEDLPGLLQRASMYISVPSTEGVSASLFEAMASGCFPIVTDLPGTRAFIKDAENGFLVPVNDPKSLALSISNYLNNAVNFQDSILSNRKFIEDNVDLNKNMQKIWEKYKSLFITKTSA
ncbi:protein involved in gliding motility RemC [Algoriphagus faecimaris]|uniref:Protein involved in gliding motility RemC n=1 Tax=Algoriphagus faecimaris TaxID=686796 RepID=A0A1G6PWT2_9BACT|nr:glycosyltransferase [Algoriphagus faecimaris]SDC83847.1 protein involved in gliding motility RemC [Algoriphagus faecimaris]